MKTIPQKTEPPIQGMKTIPNGIDFMPEAWFGCIQWTAGIPEQRAAFKKATGHDLDALTNRSGLDKLIDSATGHERTVVCAFIDWVTINVWGEAP